MLSSQAVRLLLPGVFFLGMAMQETPGQALAYWPSDPKTNVPIASFISNQTAPSVTTDGNGGAIIVWTDGRSGSGGHLYAQSISAAGIPQWTPGGVVVTIGSGLSILTPKVISDGAGGAIVAWEHRTGGLSSANIHAQRLNAAGIPQWTAGGVVITAANNRQETPELVSDGAGGAIITWSDERSDIGDIYVRRVDGTGVAQWTANGVALCTAGGGQWIPNITSDMAGGAYVTWYDARGARFDIYARRVNNTGIAMGTTNGTVICAAAEDQAYPEIIPDGTGGAIITWEDQRTDFGDVYIQKVNQGVISQWDTNGNQVFVGSGLQEWPVIASDGANGAIVAFENDIGGTRDIYIQRIDASGNPMWLPSANPVCTAGGHQRLPQIVADGSGGAIVTWTDPRDGHNDVYVQKIDANGSMLWTTDGVPVSTLAGDQRYPSIVANQGGAILAWEDERVVTLSYDVYAQRVGPIGQLGPEPVIAGVTDVPNDQGSTVKISWDASYYDTDPSPIVDEYWIWRSIPPNAALQRLSAGELLMRPSDTISTAGQRSLFTTTHGTQTFYWEYLDKVTAYHVIQGYAYLAPTAGDSTGTYNPKTAFMVMVWLTGGTMSWASDPDSGYSVDNLAPAAPVSFAGEYLSGSTTLHWLPNSELDFSEYRLYRSKDAGFVPGPVNLVAAQSDTGYVDAAGQAYFYKLSAVDTHGNESPYAFVQPAGTVDVVPDPGMPARIQLYPATPNPISQRAVIRFDLPAAAKVRLAFYDAQGRVVREAVKFQQMPAGRHEWFWDARDDAGSRVAPGVYFYTLHTGSKALTQKAVVLE
jgi:hypothetical protein